MMLSWMNRDRWPGIVLIAVLALYQTQAQTARGRILVKTRVLVDTKAITKLKIQGVHVHLLRPQQRLHVVEVAEDQAEDTLTALREDPNTEYAERDYIARVTVDTNELSGKVWHIAKIQAPQAWDISAGTNVIVAVLDSGISATHPALINRVLPGYNYLDGNTNYDDTLGHGTAVSGVIMAAVVVDAAGIACQCLVMPVKVVDDSGDAMYSSICQGLYFAADNGARVINLSITGNYPSRALQDAINYAWSHNLTVVASAGNNANSVPLYPAACSNVLAVSATTATDTLAAFSSYGDFVSLSAPGVSIWTTQRGGWYASWSGTSVASPIVAGVAALVIAVNPVLSNTQVVSILEQQVDDIGPVGWDTSFGYGRVNAFKAVNAAYNQPPVVQIRSDAAPTAVLTWSTVPGRTYTVQFKDRLSDQWSNTAPTISCAGTQAIYTEANQGKPQRFYRVKANP
jgi:thermitase